jgi:pimeloyl-ACP methyl ester carboxylesterase
VPAEFIPTDPVSTDPGSTDSVFADSLSSDSASSDPGFNIKTNRGLGSSTGTHFYVGGRTVIGKHGDTHTVGQMYVRSYPGSDPTLTPIVLFHGGAQTGYFYEHAPDGGPGFAHILAQLGRTVYVVDLPGIGRSKYYAPTDGPLTHYSAELIELIFTATSVHGQWPTAALHTQWPGTGLRGDPIFDAFYATQVGRLADEAAAEQSVRAAGAALVDRIGPCWLLTHSQSGPLGWHVADARPTDVCGIVAIEPKGPPFFDNLADPTASAPHRPFGITATKLSCDPPLPDDATSLPFTSNPAPSKYPAGTLVHQPLPLRTLTNLMALPVLVVTGEASYHATYDHATVEFLCNAGVAAEHLQLAERGIHGNGHLLPIECNRDEIAAVIEQWLLDHTR